MLGTFKKSKQSDKKDKKDNGYHPFAKEKKDPRPKNPGSGLLGNRKEASYNQAIERGSNHAATSISDAETDTDISEFLSRLSHINLQKWEGSMRSESKDESALTTEEREQSDVKANPDTFVKGGKNAVAAVGGVGQDYNGSYLFTKKPEVPDKVQGGGVIQPNTNKIKTDTSVQVNKPRPQLPPNAVRLGNKPTQLAIGANSKARVPALKTSSGKHSRIDNKVIQLKIDEDVFNTAKQGCLRSITKLLDYLERPPRINMSQELVPQYSSIRMELYNQLSDLQYGLDVDIDVLSSDISLAQSLSKLAIILGKNINAFNKSVGEIPVDLAHIIEPVVEETLRFKESLRLLVKCLPCDTATK